MQTPSLSAQLPLLHSLASIRTEVASLRRGAALGFESAWAEVQIDAEPEVGPAGEGRRGRGREERRDPASCRGRGAVVAPCRRPMPQVAIRKALRVRNADLASARRDLQSRGVVQNLGWMLRAR
jgi:hypothetical protein